MFADLFWIRKITTDPNILAHVNIVYTYDRYSELKIYIAELIFLPWHNSPSGPRPHRGLMITLRHTTIGKTPLDE